MSKGFIVAIVLAFVWGALTPHILPSAQYGYTYLLAAVVGGSLIGYFVPKIIDEKILKK